MIGARSEGKLLETRNSCLEVGGSARAVVSDVSLRNDCRLLVETCVEDYGGVDLLILNAAYSPTPQWFQNFSNAVRKYVTYVYVIDLCYVCSCASECVYHKSGNFCVKKFSCDNFLC